MLGASRLTVSLAIIALGSACSHGGSSFVPASPSYQNEAYTPNAATVTATIHIRVPSAGPVPEAPGLAHQHFVAASTRGALLRAYLHPGGKPAASIAADLSSGARDCKRGAGGRNCAIALSLPTGTYEFVIDTYDVKPKNGHFPRSAKQLAAGIASADLKNSRTVKVVLGGVVASTQTLLTPVTFPAIDPQSLPLTVEAKDADGNTIATDGYVDVKGKPVTIVMNADSAAGTTITFSPPSFKKPAAVTLVYGPGSMSGAQAASGFTSAVSAIASNHAPASATSVTFTAPQINFYTIPTTHSWPEGIATGPDGAMWFTEYCGNKIGRITTFGAIEEFALPSSSDGPDGITNGPDGALWFTGLGSDVIGRISTDGTPSSFAIPGANPPAGIATGPDGALWFAESSPNGIGRVDTFGSFAAYPLPSGSNPEGITAGPDGALWFAECSGNAIGRITTAASISSFTLPSNTRPTSLAVGSDSALWFAAASPHVGRITTSGAVSSYPIPGGGDSSGVARGPDGAIWFGVIGTATQSIGRISTSGIMTLYSLPGTNPFPTGIVAGPDGAIWFVELNANQIGRLQ